MSSKAKQSGRENGFMAAEIQRTMFGNLKGCVPRLSSKRSGNWTRSQFGLESA
jgi:hypothetical protein